MNGTSLYIVTGAPASAENQDISRQVAKAQSSARATMSEAPFFCANFVYLAALRATGLSAPKLIHDK